MSKRKRVVLSLKDKINIIDSLKKGETGRKLADKYGVGTSTISDIKKNTDSILLYTCKLDSEDGSKHRKMMKKPKNELLEDALYCWFLQKRSTGQPISGPLLCKKALELNKKLGGDESFVASNGWLYRFKSRHGIREMEMQSEKMSANVDAANSFKDDFKKKLNEYNVIEIVENILQTNEQPEMQEDETEENLDVENDAVPSHDEALHALETALKWFEKQTESDTASLLQLKLIRDIAAMKRKSGLLQMTITKYFKPN
ncbi:Jerky protein [Eumeta japonica]|uniref:Jerky protein n=1 Tax=Eumeta variegata TaxID=151549 RepID=A0A4C1YD27_EUMVA|nr:Jerky protein [Eumeta japonica]